VPGVKEVMNEVQINDQAGIWYKKIINDYPSSSYVKKAMLGLGLVQYNSKQDEAAVATYKSVVSKYPNTP
jgi:TolA-binding protein